MKISAIDIGIVISDVVFAIEVAAYYSKRASQNINEYSVSGRNLPWWVAGTSMVGRLLPLTPHWRSPASLLKRGYLATSFGGTLFRPGCYPRFCLPAYGDAQVSLPMSS